ncbi:MAG: hypothetical protein A4E72_01554 [Syntrophus sp. PtaU1.Bin208]|nr:MAG: hypothetical protein A4E72_01554 [Syntrophus sp. PtaU1.Bin208]
MRTFTEGLLNNTWVSIMAFLQKHPAVAFALILLAAMGLTATAPAANSAQTSAPKGACWTSLTFNASRLLAKLTIQIRIQSPAPQNDGLLARAGAGLTESTETLKKMKLMAVDLQASGQTFLDEQYSEKIWFNATDGRAYRRIRFMKGGKSWVKIYSWTDQGVRRQKMQPAGRYERNAPPVKWTGTKESFYHYPKNAALARPIADPTYLLYLLSAVEPQNVKSPFELLVFGKEQLHRLICRRENSLPLAVSFKTRSSGGGSGNSVAATISPIVFSVTADSFPYRGKEPEVFSLFGLERDIRIHLDPATHLPIRISGKNPLWGELVLDLSEAQLP